MGATARVGLFGIGLRTYWPQFEGLHERLLTYQASIAARLREMGAEVVDVGIVDEVDQASKTGDLFRSELVDAIFLYISTYALSQTVLPVVQRAGVPVVVLNVQPVSRIDYEHFNSLGDRGVMTGEWLAHCQACSAPEIASVFNKAGIPYHLVTGYLGEDYVWEQIREWVAAIRVRSVVRDTRFGVLGHYYAGMLDVYTDITLLASVFGSHFEILEMCELALHRDRVTAAEVQNKIKQFGAEFTVSPECDQAELERAAQTSCALDALVAKSRLGALAYYYEGTDGNAYENIVTSVITGNTLLTAHRVPVAGECEVKNAVAMKILDSFDAGGSFSEFYAIDFDDDIVLWGHDGPAHAAIAEGPVGPVPVPVYHRKPGKGLSIQMTVKYGPVTFLSVVQGRAGSTFLLVAEGESVAGPVLQIGNTNSRYRFPIHAREFVNSWSKAGPAHHCAIGVGKVASRIEKLAALLGIDCVRVC
jgi:L-arabinose isomerase